MRAIIVNTIVAAAAIVAVPAVAAERSASPLLSIMTYNVEGLPFPLREGRAGAAVRIAAQLAAMRAAGTQPHVVVLQEAFGRAQRAIGQAAGYPYVALGPGRSAINDEPIDADDRAFAAAASHRKGEADGKWAGSGLAILSDYPIVASRAQPFPAYACGGTDCLANKGVMLAEIAVPGAQSPIAVIGTHMQAKRVSGVAPARFNWAYARQVQSIGRFLRAALPADMPYVFAGDTNVGRSPARGAAIEAMLASLPRNEGSAPVRTALATCLSGDGCALAQPDELRRSLAHGKDWEAYADAGAAGLEPISASAPFGHDAHGRMLSDHIGYIATFRLPRRPG